MYLFIDLFLKGPLAVVRKRGLNTFLTHVTQERRKKEKKTG